MKHILTLRKGDTPAPLKRGPGCWIVKGADGQRYDEADAQSLFHIPPTPAPVYKSWKQRARADRKRHIANNKRLDREGRETKEQVQGRMAYEYAAWLCQRDGVTIPSAATVHRLDWSAVDADAMPGATWNQRRRVCAVLFGRMVDNEPPEGLNARERRRWRNRMAAQRFETLLTVDIPNWDHVPQVIETTDAEPARPFRPMIVEQVAA